MKRNRKEKERRKQEPSKREREECIKRGRLGHDERRIEKAKGENGSNEKER
jgi:hypothetical protein